MCQFIPFYLSTRLVPNEITFPINSSNAHPRRKLGISLPRSDEYIPKDKLKIMWFYYQKKKVSKDDMRVSI